MLKVIKYGILLIVLSMAIYMVGAVLLSFMSTRKGDYTCNQKKQVFVASNGIHLDIIFPRYLLSRDFESDLQLPDYASFIAFGWGDKEFYMNTPTWGDLTPGTALRAIFLNTETAVHLTFYQGLRPHWRPIELCDAQVSDLTQYLEGSFARNVNGDIIEIINAGYTPYDRFYEGEGNFNGILTCNEWVNRGLKKAGISTSIWSPFDFGVLYHIRNQPIH